MTPYTGNDQNYIHTINLPQNSVDNVDDTTVNPSFKILSDTDAYISRTSGTLMTPIRIYSDTSGMGVGTSMTVTPFGPIFGAVDGGLGSQWYAIQEAPVQADIGPSSLVGGGSYAANTNYFIYINPFPPASRQYFISTAPPFENLGTDSTNNGWRYLASFRTDGSSLIKPFVMVNRQYYLGSELLGTLTINNVTPSVTRNFTVPGRAAKLLFSINTKETSNTTLSWFPRFSAVSTGFASIVAQTSGTTYTDTVIDEVPTSGNFLTMGQVTVQLTNTAPTQPVTVDVYLTGYKE